MRRSDRKSKDSNSTSGINKKLGGMSNDLDIIIEMYRDYASRQTNPYIKASAERDLISMKYSTEVDKFRLKIELPISEILSIYEETGVIKLRRVTTSDKLLLGCGNGPCDSHFHDKKHDHEGFVTINPEITMNPCVIGAFGIDRGLSKVLPRDFYTELHGEAITIAETVNDFDQGALACMKSGFRTLEDGVAAVDFAHSNLFWEAPAPVADTSVKLVGESAESGNDVKMRK